MNAIKSNYTYILKSIMKDKTLLPHFHTLQNKNYVISGATRGVGLSIAKSLSSMGANVALLGKTSEPHPKLEGTLTTAVEEVKKANYWRGNKVIGFKCDIRDYDNVNNTVEEIVEEFKGINGVVLNASALCLNSTLKQTKKEIDLMSQVNINGTYIMGQKCLKYIEKEEHGNVLIIAPPISMLYNDEWWVNHLYYSMSKFNMSLMSNFWNKEFKNVSVNTLWPRTTLDTAPVRNILGGEKMANISRSPDIMGEAAKDIICANPYLCTGKNFIDDIVLLSLDKDIEKYRINKNIKETDLMPDFFC